MSIQILREVDASSGLDLLLIKLQLKLKKTTKKNTEQLFVSSRLKDPAVKSQFAWELKNKFQVLADTPADDTNALYENIQKTFLDASIEVLDYG